MNRPTAVYRMFSATGVLLYVGETYADRIRLRFREHRKTQPWWPQVARIDLAFYDWWRDACIEERRAILDEFPLYNKERHKPIGARKYQVRGWNPIPEDLKKRIRSAGRKRSKTPRRTPGRDDALAACCYEALSLGCQPGSIAHETSGVIAEDVRRLAKRYMVQHPELPPLPVRQSLANRATRALSPHPLSHAS